MDASQAIPLDPPSETEARSDTTLQGAWLRLARAGWITVSGLTAVVVVFAIPANFSKFISTFDPALEPLGLSALSWAVYYLALNLAVIFSFAAVGVVIFWLKSDDWMAIIFSLTLIVAGPIGVNTLYRLWLAQPAWRLPISLIYGLAETLFLASLYLFPNGRFVPRWTRFLSLPILLWIVASLNATFWGPGQKTIWLSDPAIAVWSGIGLYAQLYRYRRLSNPIQRQQTKWVIFGIVTSVLGFLLITSFFNFFPPLHQPGPLRSLYDLIGTPFLILFELMLPLSIGLSVLRYRLWDVDPLINRTLVYGLLTLTLGLVYFSSVALLQEFFQVLTGQQSEFAIVISTLVIAALFQPLRRGWQHQIDRRWYREKTDARQAFAAFTREVRTVIDFADVLRLLVNRTTELLHSAHGAVFLRSVERQFELSQTRNLSAEAEAACAAFLLNNHLLHRLEAGQVISRPGDKTFPLLIPLMAPQAGARPIGVLALGPRLSGQPYSRDDQTLLSSLADQAGTAIRVAQLVQEKQLEAQRRQEVEQRLEAYRNSPLGRAEATALALLNQPEAVLIELHRLAQAANQDPEAANLLANLSQALGQLAATESPAASAKFQAAQIQSIAALTDGINYILTSRFTPELLPVGLRTLIAQLEMAEAKNWIGAQESLAFYRFSQSALEVHSIASLVQVTSSLQELILVIGSLATDTRLGLDLARSLSELKAVLDGLYACERVEAPEDKLAYLASAVERLSHIDRLARTELRSLDRALIRRIAEGWLAVVTGAVSDLQSRAQIVCRLLTRHTWQEDHLTLILSLRNTGRSAAFNLRVSLATAPEYRVAAESQMAQLERLTPNEEAEIALEVYPRLVGGLKHFRARFVVLYADPRGPDQVENFADVVSLLAVEAGFHPIPNPYVIGTPLQTGSPLFFGREDVLAFIEENLTAAHRNNLVLIGQRRTGKTSLLKQIPARLSDDYFPVYLDGQTLGLDPGLPNFFLSLATEIVFALQDHGLAIEPPTLEAFAVSPAYYFESKFLNQVKALMGRGHLLILLDEFEELEASVRRGHLDDSIFGFLRHFIQHTEQVSMIFCGTHRLEELAADYWSVLFNISLYRHIGFMEAPEARRLIEEPVTAYGMRYDDLALEKMWRVTAGHPYFLQLLCHSVVNRHNHLRRSYVTVSDVNAALEEIMMLGEAHFVYLWNESTPHERLALTALSRMMPLTGQATTIQVVDYLSQRGLKTERRAMSEALHRLGLRDILSRGDAFHWHVGLLGLWVEKYKSLNRVVEESLE